MGKRFAEVIPGLKVSEELQGFLDVMTVDRVTATKGPEQDPVFHQRGASDSQADDLYAGGEYQKAGVPRLSDGGTGTGKIIIFPPVYAWKS